MNVRKITCILLGAKALVGVGFSQVQNEVQTWNMTNTLPFTVNTFSSIAIDTFGTVWAGSSGGGLYTYKNNTWSKYNAIPYPDISYRDLAIAPDGSVWAASIGKNGNLAETGGVFYINTSTNDKWIPVSVANKQLQLSLSNAGTGIINDFNSFIPSNADTVRMYANFYGLMDTLIITVLADPLANAFNYTLASGNASDPTIWSRSVIPDILDSVVVKSGHIITVDTMLRVRFLLVEPGGNMQVNPGDTLTIEPIEITVYLPFKEAKLVAADFNKIIAMKIKMYQPNKSIAFFGIITSLYNYPNHTLSKYYKEFPLKIPGFAGDS